MTDGNDTEDGVTDGNDSENGVTDGNDIAPIATIAAAAECFETREGKSGPARVQGCPRLYELEECDTRISGKDTAGVSPEQPGRERERVSKNSRASSHNIFGGFILFLLLHCIGRNNNRYLESLRKHKDICDSKPKITRLVVSPADRQFVFMEFCKTDNCN